MSAQVCRILKLLYIFYVYCIMNCDKVIVYYSFIHMNAFAFTKGTCPQDYPKARGSKYKVLPFYLYASVKHG